MGLIRLADVPIVKIKHLVRGTKFYPSLRCIKKGFKAGDSARSSLFTLFSRFFTLTPGNKMPTKYVAVDQCAPRHHRGIRVGLH